MKINELGLGFDLPSRSGALSFVKGSNFGPNEIAVTTTRNKKPLYFGLDHNEDLLMVDHFLQVNPIKNPLIKVLVDSHSDITNFPYYPDECLLGSWLQNAFDIGQADETAGLYWFYRLKGNAPSDFNGNTLDLPNFQGSGIKVTAVCIDGYEQNHKAIAKMDELRLLAQKGRVIGGSIDWDAGMGPNPHIDPSTKPDGYDLTENQNMEQHQRHRSSCRGMPPHSTYFFNSFARPALNSTGAS